MHVGNLYEIFIHAGHLKEMSKQQNCLRDMRVNKSVRMLSFAIRGYGAESGDLELFILFKVVPPKSHSSSFFNILVKLVDILVYASL